MPLSPEEFLRGYRSEDEQNFDEWRQSQWDDVDYSGPSVLGRPGIPPTTGQSYVPPSASQRPTYVPTNEPPIFDPANLPQRSIFNPKAIKETYTRALNNPNRVKQEIIAETIGRFDQNPTVDFTTQEGAEQGVRIAGQVLTDAKSQGLNRTGSWRDATTSSGLSEARDYLNAKREAFSRLGEFGFNPLKNAANSALEKTGLKNIGSSANAFLENIKLPSFISGPLALRNPVVAANSSIQEGSLVNPQAVKFLKEFDPKQDPSFGTTFTSPFGTNVQVSHSPRSSTYDIAFQGPFGYRQSGSIKKEIKENLAHADWLESQGDTEQAASQRDRAMNMQEMLNEPLRSPALRYTLGEALQSVPVGGTVTAAPIGAEKGSRARIYSALTNDALATFKGITPNPGQLPTNEEFRAYDEGRGYSLRDLAPINRNRGRIITERLGPTTWKNINKEEKVFDPATLKDPMIRATYNLPENADVSELRENPLGLFERTNRIDFTKPVITTDSPIYKFRKGVKGGIGIGAADFIPSPEAIRDIYAGKPLSALQRTGQNIVQSIPLAAAVGGTVAAAPALAPIAGATGTAMALNALGAAGNEVVRQQTGEGIIPKVRQFLGTVPRTGRASAPQPVRPYVTPRLVQTKPVNPITQEIQNRLGLAASRFNPAKGEFGLSEMFFGR